MKRTVLILALLAAACGIHGGSRGLEVVATLDGEPLLRTDLELYFRVNLIDAPGSEPGQGQSDFADLDRVKSRLFDAFVEEQALVAEARRREIEVSDEEVEAYLDLARAEGYGVTKLALESRRVLAKTRLLVQKLHERVAEQVAPPTEEEVAEFASRNDKLPGTGKRVLVRVLPLDSEETAKSLYADIRRTRTTFAEAARVHETQPGQAAPQALDWDSLPEAVRSALKELKPGEVSAPLDHNGLIYLFQVQAWLEDGDWSERERLRTAREELERRKRSEARDRLVEELMRNRVVRLAPEHLGFRYVPEEGS